MSRGTPGAAFDWAFRDRRTGRITIGQRPNAPLAVGLGCAAAAWAAGRAGAAPAAATALRAAAGASLAWWAVGEVVDGVNPWRRFLGGCALAGLALRYRPRPGPPAPRQCSLQVRPGRGVAPPTPDRE